MCDKFSITQSTSEKRNVGRTGAYKLVPRHSEHYTAQRVPAIKECSGSKNAS